MQNEKTNWVTQKPTKRCGLMKGRENRIDTTDIARLVKVSEYLRFDSSTSIGPNSNVRYSEFSLFWEVRSLVLEFGDWEVQNWVLGILKAINFLAK